MKAMARRLAELERQRSGHKERAAIDLSWLTDDELMELERLLQVGETEAAEAFWSVLLCDRL